jgi:glycogen operon protein
MKESLTAAGGGGRPLGASLVPGGVNFAVFSQHAERIEVCLFDASGQRELARYTLAGRTGDVWHGIVPSPQAEVGTLYGLRAHGPYAPREGHRFNPNKLLLDPAALDVVGDVQWVPAIFGDDRSDPAAIRADMTDSAAAMPRCRVVDLKYDWRGDRQPATPWRDSFIYELHVKGFTQQHPDVPPAWRGKYLGLTVPAVLGHLKSLGVTAVELMPVQAFTTEGFLRDRGLANYWGYNSIGWSAPSRAYAVDDPIREFRDMVRALHGAGIEVILDVVYNHTAEGNELGPTLSLRGLDNRIYYRLRPTDRRHYENMTGCGNTIAADQPAVSQLILDSLRFWAEEMHVDGFRFDLAPVLARDWGGFNSNAPFFAALRADPVLAYVKLIAEPWDVGLGGYQLGNFPAGWAEWNDRYRDTVRAYWRGDGRMLGSFAERVAGSSDLFRRSGRKPTASINFLAAHDGFTLRDVVSYNERHNEANLEGNHDGHADNLSWNGGIEGPTNDAAVVQLRERQVRNMLTTLFFSQGVPMLQAGDEFGRTQRGNNNAYCQDNEMSWVDWRLARENSALLEFVRRLSRLRVDRPELRRDTFLKGSRIAHQSRDIMWWHPRGHEMIESDWHDPGLRTFGIAIGAHGSSVDLLLLLNPTDAAVEFTLPPAAAARTWQAVLDTASGANEGGLAISDRVFRVGARSAVALEQSDL